MQARYLILACVPLVAHETLETTKSKIISILAHKNPIVIPEFAIFFAQHDERVRSFFNLLNTEPLAVHIQQMERELDLLGSVCRDKRFACVQHILYDHHAHVAELLTVLKKYIGRRDALSLAFAVRRFKGLLPYDVKKRGDFELFWVLQHRLVC